MALLQKKKSWVFNIREKTDLDLLGVWSLGCFTTLRFGTENEDYRSWNADANAVVHTREEKKKGKSLLAYEGDAFCL